MLFYRVALILILSVQFLTSFCSQASNQPSEKHPEQRIQDYEKLVKRYRYYKPDSATFFAKKGMALALARKDSTGLARMLNQLGMIDDNFGKFIESRQKYLRAASIYREIGDKKGEAAETIRLGVVELRKGNYDKAIGYFLDALKLSESINDKAGIMEANVTLGEGYMGQKQYDKALVYLKKAEQLDKKLPFSGLSLNICNNFGIVYREKKEFGNAIFYIKKGINQSSKPEFWGLNITLINNLASVYAKAGNKDKSIELLESALKRSREIQNYIRELQTLTALADVYGKDNAQKSLGYLHDGLKLVREKGAYRQEIDILQRLGDLHKYLKNYKEALSLKERSNALADSFFYQDMAQQISNLQAEYELSKSQARVKELKYENARQSLERKIILGITACVLIVLLIVGYFYLKTKKLNALLNKANASLKESNTVKDKFFSILAHDLRLPITSVINLLFIIDDDDITPDEKHEIVGKLIVNCNASLDTLNQLLKWGEMQIKGIRLKPQNFNPAAIVDRNVQLLSATAENKLIKIENFVQPDIELYSDPDHFDFVVRNMLSNAIKFTTRGGKVSILAETKGAETQFTIKDTGVGIENERLDSIFQITNVSTTGTNNEKGTSLGLIMCKDFIEANKGSISVKSEKGVGSDFIFTLPSSSS
ncbi:tetratricopeptide repeat protein [Arcticibacter sp. MXS-1]|uniref:tetratricopeptide repeat-containing sensor histidine kinase n=1 Tax=Arcticibacter sp. MXS-1 TaxID=3341726 RepID=UPI0035A8D425